MKITKGVIRHFSKSKDAHAQLTKQRKEQGVAFGLQKVSKTRFGNIYWSTKSVVDNLSIILSLVGDGDVHFQVCSTAANGGWFLSLYAHRKTALQR